MATEVQIESSCHKRSAQACIAGEAEREESVGERVNARLRMAATRRGLYILPDSGKRASSEPAKLYATWYLAEALGLRAAVHTPYLAASPELASGCWAVQARYLNWQSI